MRENTLITGGAGFIGSHLARRLLEQGHAVRVLDVLDPQVHANRERPPYLADQVELVIGDVRDRNTVARALQDIDAVVHLAARVGVGQSMYEISQYQDVNTYGTGVLLEALVDHRPRKLVVASSMSIYGEGLYRKPDGRVSEVASRERAQLERGGWELRDPDGTRLEPVATPEWKRPSLSSIYALGKYDQERMCLLFGQAYEIPAVALRFFNVYGPDQALSNPYTGVLAIFANRLLNDRPPLVFEDGEQRRDFVSVADATRACVLALEKQDGDGLALNVGSSRSVSVREVAERLATAVGKDQIEPEITGKYRVGDVRHCFADIELARNTLDFQPQVELEEGMAELAQWLEGRTAEDRVDLAAAELAARGLTV
jgi:dTDP-L-rhamnose 4-epimerase